LAEKTRLNAKKKKKKYSLYPICQSQIPDSLAPGTTDKLSTMIGDDRESGVEHARMVPKKCTVHPQ
jgi:hypothetical protein